MPGRFEECDERAFSMGSSQNNRSFMKTKKTAQEKIYSANSYRASLKLSRVKQKLSLIFASLRRNFFEAVNLANNSIVALYLTPQKPTKGF